MKHDNDDLHIHEVDVRNDPIDFEKDPMAEFEGEQQTTLAWPDKKKRNSEENETDDPLLHANDSEQPTVNSDTEKAADDEVTAEVKHALDFDNDDALFTYNDEQERQHDSSDLLSKHSEETLDEAPKKRSLFSLIEKKTKPKKRKGAPAKEEPVTDKEELQLVDDIDEQKSSFNVVKVGWGVTKIMATAGVAIGMYFLYADLNEIKSSQNNSASEMREQVLAEMQSLEQRVLNTSGQLQTDIEGIGEQLAAMKTAAKLRDKQLEDLMDGSDSELEIAAIREMVELDRSIINKLDASVEKMEGDITGLKDKATNIVINKRITPNKPKPKRNVTRTVKNIEGYSLFSVDLWGNTPLLVLVKGTEIKRLKEGASIAGWRVTSIDSYKKQATLQKGNITNHLQG